MRREQRGRSVIFHRQYFLADLGKNKLIPYSIMLPRERDRAPRIPDTEWISARNRIELAFAVYQIFSRLMITDYNILYLS